MRLPTWFARITALLLCASLASWPMRGNWAWAEAPNCEVSEAGAKGPLAGHQIQQLAAQVCAVKVAASPPVETLADGLIRGSGQCLVGIGQGLVSFVEGIYAFLKLILADAPAWVWDNAKAAIKAKWDGASDAITGAADVADENKSTMDFYLEKAAAYYQAFKGFMATVAQVIKKEWAEFQCMPAEEQSRILCRMISEVFFTVVSVDKIMKGVAWVTDLAKASKDFVGKLRSTQSLSGLSMAERLRAAGQTVSTIESRGTTVVRLDNMNVVQYTNARGDEILKLEETVKMDDGSSARVARELIKDSKTGAIDSNPDTGRRLLETMVAKSSDKGALIFIDVNHLGKVNYFTEGTTAGDKYLTKIGQTVDKHVRTEDLVFKNGGDELVVIVDSADPEVVRRISSKISESVSKDPELRQMFRSEVGKHVKTYKGIERAMEISDLPSSVRRGLTSEQEYLAKRNFPALREQLKEQTLKAAQAQSAYRPSISIGSTTLREDTLASALSRAERQASEMKIEYKREIGLDIKKYDESGTMIDKPNRKVQPRVRPPVEPPKIVVPDAPQLPSSGVFDR